MKSIARVKRGPLGVETTVGKGPVDTTADTDLVLGSIHAEMIVLLTERISLDVDLQKEGRDLRENGPPTGLALRTHAGTEVKGTDMTGGADITMCH